MPTKPPRPNVLRSRWRHLLAAPNTVDTSRLWADVRSRHPRFTTAVAADARMAAANRGDRFEFTSDLDTAVQVLRLAMVTDAFGALVCYRAKAALQARGIPFLPRLLHRLAVTQGQIAIGDPVVVAAGVYLPHGQVVIDGMTTVHAGAVLSPFVTIGLRGGDVVGPVIGPRAYLGTGAKVLGPVQVGEAATVGANAVVVSDVPPGTTARGVPARSKP